jgi:hypothetical protein
MALHNHQNSQWYTNETIAVILSISDNIQNWNYSEPRTERRKEQHVLGLQQGGSVLAVHFNWLNQSLVHRISR